jgi:hypothetical protein
MASAMPLFGRPENRVIPATAVSQQDLLSEGAELPPFF